MKFSYNLFKKYLPELKSKEQVEEALSMHVFETEKSKGDTIDVSISPNRYSDGASHIGLAKELKSILKTKKDNIPNLLFDNQDKEINGIKIKVKENKLCPRYTARVFKGVSVQESPDWLKKVLEDCGLRPINNIVDIMNFVMLETGQPLHAFDFDKLDKIEVRLAKDNEEFISIDGNKYELSKDDLVISGDSEVLAIAGIKGGKSAEVTKDTENILVESANLDGVSIYNTSRNINLITDASLKFSHNLNPNLSLVGLNRAEEVLNELLGVKSIGSFDSNPEEIPTIKIPFDLDSINRLLGLNLSKERVKDILTSLDFSFEENNIIVPVLRDDIRIIEDVAEEVARVIGFNNIDSEPPMVNLKPSSLQDIFIFKSRIRSLLTGFGFDEVYLHSFVSERNEDSVEVLNPISSEKKYLRKNLRDSILKSVKENRKFFDKVKIFEIGKVFSIKEGETYKLSVATFDVNNDPVLVLKGVIEGIFSSFGIADYHFSESDNFTGLEVKVDNNILGSIHYYKNTSVMEVNLSELLKLIKEEIEFRPLPKYPSVERDISFVIGDGVKIGEVIQEIQLSNKELINDVDLVDEYIGDNGEQSLTLRIIFQSEERTLSSDEINREMNKINSLLEDKFNLSIR